MGILLVNHQVLSGLSEKWTLGDRRQKCVCSASTLYLEQADPPTLLGKQQVSKGQRTRETISNRSYCCLSHTTKSLLWNEKQADGWR